MCQLTDGARGAGRQKLSLIKLYAQKQKRCNALDGEGTQCRKSSALTLEYFGDGELYKLRGSKGIEVHWAKINLCIDHYIGAGGSFLPNTK